MDSSDISSVSSDLSSQQILVNQLKQKLQKNESLLKGRENEYQELQTKFNKLKFLHKSKTSTASAESTPTRTVPAEDRMTTSTSEPSQALDSANRGKFLLLKKQLEESRALVQRHETENQYLKRELQELRDRQIKLEAERDDREVEVITTTESTGDQRVDDMFAQIVYKDTKIMEMNQKTNDLEAKIMDLQENLKEQNEVLQARNRAIKVLLAQQQDGSGSLGFGFEEVVQREEEKERIEKLKERVAELEMEKGNLQLRVMELEGTNGSKPPLFDIELERDSLSAERDELKVKFNELMAKYDSLELQNDRVMSEKERIASELRKMKDINHNLSKDKDKQKTEIDRLSQTIAGIQQNHSLVTNELKELKATIGEKDNEIQSVRQQLSDLALKSKHMITEKDSLITELTEQLSLKSDDSVVKEKDELIQKLTKKLENAKNENWSLVNLNEELKQQCSQLEERFQRFESDSELQKNNFEKLLAEKAEIEAERQRLNEDFTRDVQILSDENSGLKSRLETSFTQLAEYEQKFLDFSNKSDSESNEFITEIENLKTINKQLENSFNDKVNQLEDQVRNLSQELETLSEEKSNVFDQLESLRHELEEERQLKLNAIKDLEELGNSAGNDNQLILEKDESIRRLQEELQKCQNVIASNNEKLEDLEREKEESTNFIKELETDLEEKIRAFDDLNVLFNEKENLLKEKTQLFDEMYEQKQDMEKKFEEAKVKNQTLANQMENLIKIVEIESQEKERLKQSLENLQKENFNESDLIREKDLRIENLQKEIRKQVEDMQEVEELLNEKTNEIEELTANVVRVQKEKTELENINEDLTKKLDSITGDSNEELMALKRDIEDLNEENDWNKNEIKILNEKMVEELREKERLESREEENRLTIAELRKQLESQEMKLTEAMNELMRKSDVNTDTNLLLNEIQTLRQTIETMEVHNHSLQTDYQKSISQLDAAVNEYKALLDESRHQIDRLETEKLSAVQETNKVNQVLETERQTQTMISDQNEELRQQIANLESELDAIRGQNQNQLESESIQNDRINQLNQTIDDLRKDNTELNTQLDQLRQLNEELQNNSSKQLEEMQIKSNTEKSEFEQKLSDLQCAVDGMSQNKEQSETNCFELQKQIQELHILIQNKDIEIANLKRLEESHQKSCNENTELSQRFADLQTTVQMLGEEKSRFEFAYNDLVHRYQELNHLVHTKNYEIETLKQLENSNKSLSDSLNNLNQEKNHLLTVLNEKQESIDKQNNEKEKLIEEKEEIERSLRESEHNISQLKTRIQELTQSTANPSNTESLVKEDELQNRIQELEQQLQESQHFSTETDNKLSEVEYELDILKKNYNLEMDSLSAQVQERETMADKLQERNEKYKRKVDKMDKIIKELTEKESYFKSKIEESEGLIKYEQMQRQSVTDSRIFELQQQLKDRENDLQMENMNLRADVSNLIASEEQLRQRIRDMEQTSSPRPPREETLQEIANYRSQIESLVNQLEAERIEKRRIQELYQSGGGQNTDQINQLLAQMEAQRQQQIAQRQELELKCKKFAAKFKVKEREVNSLEEKLRIAKENASKNVNEEELIDSNKKIEELTKKVDDLQFTASNLDSALQIERQKRRELENEKQTFWSQPSRASDVTETDRQSSSFSLLIDEGNGDKSGLGSAKRFLNRQRHYLLRGPPNAKYKRIAIAIYLAVIHILFIKACLF